jgi:hypothetical protein
MEHRIMNEQTPHEKLYPSICPQCGKIRDVRKHRIGTICKDCRINNIRLNIGHNNKGGTSYRDGYVFIYQPSHHRSGSNGYVKRAIIVLENKLGRELVDNEIAHHINSIKDDDRPENLQEIMFNEHTSLTNREQHKVERMREFRWK